VVLSLSKPGRVKDKWRSKKWYSVVAPGYFGSVEIGSIPTDETENIVGRTVESTLYDITEDFAHQYLKMYFQVVGVDGRRALTIFKGHEYSRDYLRSLVRRRTTRIDRIITVTTKDGYTMRISACAFTLTRIRTSQEKVIRAIMQRIIEVKTASLTFDQVVQEIVLGKIASDIYNEAKKISPLRHVGIRKTSLISKPTTEAEVPSEATTEAAPEAVEEAAS
jgi:small subunit ribosomal protein S3Ae